MSDGMSQGLRGAAVTATTRAKVTPSAGNAYIQNETGQDCTVVAVSVFAIGTLETGVGGAGGLIEVKNTTVTYEPFQFYTEMPHELTATSGGFVFQMPTLVQVCKPFPADSKIEFYATPLDDQSQQFECIVHYVAGNIDNGEAKFIDTAQGTAVTAVTESAANASITFPAGKGGTIIWAKAWSLKAAAVVVGTDVCYMGGKVAFRSKAKGWNSAPFEFQTGAPSGLVAGAYMVQAVKIPVGRYMPSLGTLLVDYTPYNDASQQLMLTIGWR